MRKGIIMEINERFLTMLTPDGQFLQISHNGEDYRLGQEIIVPVKERENVLSLSFFNSLKGKSLAAFAIACILTIITLIPINQDEVYAYMSIDINPSIEIGINEDLEVIELIPYNHSGKKLIEELPEWEKKDIREVTGSILKSLKGNGYLTSEQNIVIGTVHTGDMIEKSEHKLEEVMEDMNKKITEEKATLISVEATIKEREQAIENGVTTGKLVIEKEEKEKTLKREIEVQVQENKKQEKQSKFNQNNKQNPTVDKNVRQEQDQPQRKEKNKNHENKAQNQKDKNSIGEEKSQKPIQENLKGNDQKGKIDKPNKEKPNQEKPKKAQENNGKGYNKQEKSIPQNSSKKGKED